MDDPPAIPDVPPGLSADLSPATQRLLRSVDGLDDGAYRAASLLPGWTRGHVVAHLALNAEGLTGGLLGVLEDDPTSMYQSQEARDGDIEELSADSPATLRARLFGSATAFADALARLEEAGPEAAATVVERTPGGERTFLAGEAVLMRLREVEIHHVDLDAGYGRADWPSSFGALLLDDFAGRVAATLVATDLRRTYDASGPTVSGTAADLGWWLTGRGSGEGLSGDGELPAIRAW